MGAYKPSTLIDFEQGRPLELDALFLLPLAHAKAAGFSMPALSRLASVLGELADPPAPQGTHVEPQGCHPV
jgi:2-dehydropantoate 2-reductase